MYTHQKEQFRSAGFSLTAATQARFSPALRPFVLRQVAVAVTTAAATNAVITIRHRPTAGSATGQTTVDTITVPAARAAGDVIYLKGLNQRVEPGQDIEFLVTTTAAAGSVDLAADFDPAWDQIANKTNAYETA
jgi:hypothetical protein